MLNELFCFDEKRQYNSLKKNKKNLKICTSTKEQGQPPNDNI